MVRTTRKQREAIALVVDRTLPRKAIQTQREAHEWLDAYRARRESAQPTIGMDGAIVMPWAGMWLAIETDGHTHS